jgi:SagB-type dehydrogenase family enzyme
MNEDRLTQPGQICLPQPDFKGKVSLEEAIVQRRAQRVFLQKELSLQQISQLLWAAQGVTGKRQEDDVDLRSAPSAAAKYPMDVYVLTAGGVFHYVSKGHCLGTVKKEDLRIALSDLAGRKQIIRSAPVTFVITAVYERVTQRFGERGTMYVHIEAGHIAQNIHLQAVALGLASVPMGAFEEEKVKELLSLPAERRPIYMIPVGYAD